MWLQLLAIVWAQWRMMRNRLPRTSAGSVAASILALLWYGMYAALAVALADVLPQAPLASIQMWLPVGLLWVFWFWQFFPLVTLSAGRSLDLYPLQVFPIRREALFFIEIVLALTVAPEMILVLLGAVAGLCRNAQVTMLGPLLLLLYVPFNLFLSVAIRDALRRFVRGGHLHEIVALVIVALSIAPTYVLSSNIGHQSRGLVMTVAASGWTPWKAVATLATGPVLISAVVTIALWSLGAYVFARWQFAKNLVYGEEFSAEADRSREQDARAGSRRSIRSWLIGVSWDIFPDPISALIQKELRSLWRIPRFRVILAMACLLGSLLCTQIAWQQHAAAFARDYLLPAVNLYGFLLLGEVLLWNTLGFDRGATQMYFVAPVQFRTVLYAKNLVAVFFLLFQTVVVLCVVVLLRVPISGTSIANEFVVMTVAGVYFLAAGNLTSVVLPKSVDPNQTFRKQASGVVQAWLLLSSIGIAGLLGFAYLARYAFGTNWAFLSVSLLEFGIGVLVYRIATDSAVDRALRQRERLLEVLAGR